MLYACKINTETKKVKRDQIETTLQEEFGINDSQAEALLNSVGDLINYFDLKQCLGLHELHLHFHYLYLHHKSSTSDANFH